MPITYHKEEIEFELPDEQNLSRWLMNVAEAEAGVIREISYVFCSDDYLLQINKEYLKHDYYTDIITFPYKEGKEVESDIFISIDRVRDNAQAFDASFEKELLRVISHGLLHLLGYKDKSEEEEKTMRQKEDWAIDLYYQLNK